MVADEQMTDEQVKQGVNVVHADEFYFNHWCSSIKLS